MDTFDKALSPKYLFGKEIERIERLPQIERWQEIRKLLFRINPSLIPLDKGHVEAVAEQRNFGMLKETGASKSNDMRALMSLPQYVYMAIKVADPDFDDEQKDKQKVTALYRKLTKAFPEYSLARKI